MPSIAIIGAGVSGLAAAHTLRDAGNTVVLYEKDQEVGGRAATRQQAGFIYDYGAQYVRYGNPASVALITERFRSPDLIDIGKPIWIFDRAGQIQPGDPTQNVGPQWSYRHGLHVLPKRMAEGLDIHSGTSITHIQRHSNGWTLFTAEGPEPDHFDAILVTIPAPQASTLMQNSQLDPHLHAAISTQLDKVRYNPLISVMLGYRPRPQARPYYALVNTDKAHAISWLAWEHEKCAERAHAQTGLLIAQMAPQYSQEHMQTADSEIMQDVATRVASLLAETLPTPFFADIVRWHYALPTTRADAEALNARTIPAGLAFCGDAFVGGRLHLALEHGIKISGSVAICTKIGKFITPPERLF